ncbi:hypothetical protein NUH86_19260 [Sphingobium sp. JS3065]|uniref:tetratricopeptide repeat protein n=1 Tax=Sphingobium sp. JS3065 TaxID=2970925 RepID=UPI0022642EFC|nr:hypothetical protein [Sphingobium sp. JS3065]UZW57707.1 hypothetical protein NUH86_19260 [Sphingobium sp. JS3065]
MAGERNDPLSLPDPPPPAPARREAAIEAALHRFDGTEQSAPTVADHTPARPWRLLDRPYLGGALALSLLALVVLPVAWVSMPRRDAPSPPRVARPQEQQAAADPAIPPQPVRAEPPAAAAEKPVARPTAPAPAPILEGAVAPPEPPPAMQAYGHMAAAPAAAPAAPPPPPAAIVHAEVAEKAARMASGNEDARDILVTSAKVDPKLLRGRGDWNACTVQDPRQDLAACKRRIREKDLAAAPITDGLTRAWQGEWRDAAAAFDRAVALAPKSADAYLNRAMVRQALGEGDKALEDFDRAVRYAPYAARTYYHRSLLLRQRGEARKAEADRNRAAELDSRYDPD